MTPFVREAIEQLRKTHPELFKRKPPYKRLERNTYATRDTNGIERHKI